MKKFLGIPLSRDKDKDDTDTSPASSPRGLMKSSPRRAKSPGRSPRNEPPSKLASIFTVQLLGATPPFAVRLKYKQATAALSHATAAVLWLMDDDSRLSFESIKPGKDKPTASISAVLRDSVEETMEVFFCCPFFFS